MIRAVRGYEKAVWQGLTQMEERKFGVDEILRNLGSGRYLMLQFKAPWPSSIVDTDYKFSINTQQHLTLEQGPCRICPGSAFYVLPLFSTWKKVYSYLPFLVQDTWLLKAKDVNLTTYPSLQQRHRLEIRKKNSRIPSAKIFSPEINAEIMNASQVFHEPSDFVPKETWLPSGVLREWVRSVIGQFPYYRFRGLHALFTPE